MKHRLVERIRQLIVILIVGTTLNSCGPVIRVVLGVDTTPKWLDTRKDIDKQANRFGINPNQVYVLDRSSLYASTYNDFRDSLSLIMNADSVDCDKHDLLQEALQDDCQPTQFRLYDSTGKEIFQMVGCYIDPIIPMNWNVDGCFNTFPPETSVPSLNVHNHNLSFVLSHLENPITLEDMPASKYYAVVLWNSIYIRPTKRLIEAIEEHIGLDREDITMLYLNNHNLEIWSMMSAEERNNIKSP
ncbi:MAG: hypothetical protein JJ975_07530 [Bacteroidia bacterium]|nr:hypothetical protein [Bacteroidia bacterium]